MNPDPQDSNSRPIDEELLTAYALGQLGERERAAVEAELAGNDAARRLVEETVALADHVHQANRHGPSPQPSPALRGAIEQRLNEMEEIPMSTKESPSPSVEPVRHRRSWGILAAATCLLIAAVPITWAIIDATRSSDDEMAMAPEETAGEAPDEQDEADIDNSVGTVSSRVDPGGVSVIASTERRDSADKDLHVRGDLYGTDGDREIQRGGETSPRPAKRMQPLPPAEPASSDYTVSNPRLTTKSLPPARVIFSSPGGTGRAAGVELGEAAATLNVDSTIVITGGGVQNYKSVAGSNWEDRSGNSGQKREEEAPGTEQYDAIVENNFVRAVGKKAVSTFSIDVDTASYANVRRFLTSGRLPPPNAVRIEEMINYFSYDYPPPEGNVPFSVQMETAACPWTADHRLLRIGIKGREIDRGQRGPSNLVFLLDVSGSMRGGNKLPLVKQGMKWLVKQLGEDDRVAIVTYASGTKVRLDSTGGHERQRILEAIDSLTAGGSTHGSAGIELAYRQAAAHFVEGGTNRVILATDGDLNVGITDDNALVKLIKEKAKTGVFLTVLGFGTGNLKDSKMEKLADHGNGIYAYIDNAAEAHKVLVEQLTGSLVTIAKDVKIQIEFNPAAVHSYRLIGYENRMLAAGDFDDDRKDAGEIGAGHTVTALYEIVPSDGKQADAAKENEGLKYQRVRAHDLSEQAASGETATLRLRYKQPEAEMSEKLEFVVKDAGKRFGEASADLRFAAAVAAFGMKLRGSKHAGDLTLAAVEEFATGAVGGNDPGGWRSEFVELVRQAKQLSSQ